MILSILCVVLRWTKAYSCLDINCTHLSFHLYTVAMRMNELLVWARVEWELSFITILFYYLQFVTLEQ